MLYFLLREEADPELLKTFVKEADEVLGDGPPPYETHKKQKFAEAWYVYGHLFSSFAFMFALSSWRSIKSIFHGRLSSSILLLLACSRVSSQANLIIVTFFFASYNNHLVI